MTRVNVYHNRWYDNGQKCEEIRYNDKGVIASFVSWYDNGQKYVEIRYNDKGEQISYNRWYDNGQKRN
jgi:antitoxin component YwqK of YwqJK toxin-antitoxin module